MKKCTAPDCVRVQYAKGLCKTHYMRKYRGIGLEVPIRKRAAKDEIRLCEVEGCNHRHLASGLCSRHYQKAHPRTTDWSSWRVGPDGYVVSTRTVEGKRQTRSQHREVMKEKLGRELLPGENVHHINGVRNDNRPENLELWTTAQPAGQRVEDKVAWAIEFLEQYGYVLSSKGLAATLK